MDHSEIQNRAEELHQEADTEEEMEKEDQIFDLREESDFVIIVEGTKLHVAKNILSLASPVFDRMFQSDFKEQEKGEIEMPGKKREDVKLFLQCIYPNTLKQVTFETAMKILPLIEEYQVFQLKTTCEKAIFDDVNEDTSTESLYQVLNTACTYSLEFVRDKCVGLVANKSTKDSELAKKKYPLPAEVMNEILTMNISDLETSNKNLKANISELRTNVTSLEAKMEIMSSNMDIFKEYVAKDVLDTKHMSLVSTCKWKSNEVLMKLNSKSLNAVCNLVVWDVKLAITAKETGTTTRYLCLSVVTKNLEDSSKTIDIKVKSVLLNGESKSKNFSRVFHGQIRPSNREVVENVAQLPYITHETNGFIKNGHIWLLIQLFLSEPKAQ